VATAVTVATTGAAQPPGPTLSFAEVVSKGKAKCDTNKLDIKKIAKMAFQKPKSKKTASKNADGSSQPTEFAKIQFAINPSALKKCKNQKDKISALWAIVRELGIRKSVFEVSKVGNAVAEIYVPTAEETRIKEILDKKGAELKTIDPNPNNTNGKGGDRVRQATDRLAIIYHRATLKKLKECIIRGLSESMISTIKEKDAIMNKAGQAKKTKIKTKTKNLPNKNKQAKQTLSNPEATPGNTEVSESQPMDTEAVVTQW
jgi:hypothetical protein